MSAAAEAAPSGQGLPGRALPERRRLYRYLLVSALVAIAAVAAAGGLARLAETRESALRELRVEEQRLEQRARRLAEPGTGTTLAALGENRDALRVRIIEALSEARRAAGVTRLGHVVDERAIPATEGAATLRLTLEGRLAHGALLLDLLAAVRAATAPWPSETRGCLLQRLDPGGLLIDCTVDVLHWTALRVPHGG